MRTAAEPETSMPRGCIALFAAVLAIARAQAQPAIDYEREERWAQEVVPSVVVGDVVWLTTPTQAKVLAILTMPPSESKGGVIVIHGLGVHPDFGMLAPSYFSRSLLQWQSSARRVVNPCQGEVCRHRAFHDNDK